MSTTLSKNEEFKMSNTIIENSIVNQLHKLFNNHVHRILKDISSSYSLELEDLCNKYITNNSIDMDIQTGIQNKRTRRKNKPVSKVELCMARKADMCQCTRRRKDNTEYCGKHSGVLKYGRIDDEDKYSNTEQFIQCKPIQINGIDYLIDSRQVVYTHDVDSPSIVGKLNDSGEITMLTSLEQTS